MAYFSRKFGSHASTTGGLSVGYYANDLVASQTQGARTLGFTLDPMQTRLVDTTDTAGTTSTNHYADSSDSPAWTNTGTAWSRNLTGITGGLAATQDQAGVVTLQLANMHGDIVATATATDTGTATAISSYSESTEYGTPRTAAAAPDSYGWLGTKRRSTNDLGGLTLMGVRLYNPATGRFLSEDPLPGGMTIRMYTSPTLMTTMTSMARPLLGTLPRSLKTVRRSLIE